MPEIVGYTSGVGSGTNLVQFRGWWYPLFQRCLCTISNKLIARSKVENGADKPAGKSITLNMPEIDGYISGVSSGTNLVPFGGWWYPLFQSFL